MPTLAPSSPLRVPSPINGRRDSLLQREKENISLALYCESHTAERHTCAITLAHQLNIPIATQTSDSFLYLLVITDSHLELRQTNTNTKPIYVDFLNTAYQYRRLTSNRKNELIAKAVGIKGIERPSIVDATAGLGVDGFVLANFGCVVHWLERSAVIAALLQDGMNRLWSGSSATMQEVAEERLKLSLTVTDAIAYFENLAAVEFPDVIYLDPMFPTRHKSALVKKEMRMLRDIVGYDLDAPALLALALKCAKKRVVVKRPRLASMIEGRDPDVVYQGQSNRFDVYLKN